MCVTLETLSLSFENPKKKKKKKKLCLCCAVFFLILILICYMKMMMGSSFPEEVLEHVFSFIERDKDRNAISTVCQSWYEIERWSRRRVFVGNCYAVSPAILIKRFPDVRCLELKGKPHFADFNLVPEGWGAYVAPWIAAASSAYPWLEEIRLKRMVIPDDSLELISKSFKNFKVLVLSSCEGFSTEGLAAIAANCRFSLTQIERFKPFCVEDLVFSLKC